MSFMKEQLKVLIDYKLKMKELMSQIEEAEDSLTGMDLLYKGDFATVEYADANSQNVSLYVEDDEGKSNSLYIPLQELYELLVD